MPRTSRRTATSGLLWEALAPAVRWPLHSPRRLAALLAALVALVWVLAAVRGSAAADPAPTSPATSSSAASTSSAAASSASGPVASGPSATAPPIPPTATSSPSPGEVAVRFVTVWARPDLPVEAWQADVIPVATPTFAAQLRTVLPANVPARKVTGSPVVGSVSELGASVTVPTDAGPVLVDLAVMSGTWKVSGVVLTGPRPSGTNSADSSLAATYTPLPAGG